MADKARGKRLRETRTSHKVLTAEAELSVTKPMRCGIRKYLETKPHVFNAALVRKMYARFPEWLAVPRYPSTFDGTTEYFRIEVELFASLVQLRMIN